MRELFASDDDDASSSHLRQVRALVHRFDSSHGLDAVGGLDATKRELRASVVLPLRYPRVFGGRGGSNKERWRANTEGGSNKEGGRTNKRSKSNNKQLRTNEPDSLLITTIPSPPLSPSGVLLHGPPGTGKTMLARAIAAESGVPMICLHAAALESKWWGESVKLLAAAFAHAREIAPCIVFFDEIDGFGRARSDADHACVYSFKCELLRNMDGIEAKEDKKIEEGGKEAGRLEGGKEGIMEGGKKEGIIEGVEKWMRKLWTKKPAELRRGGGKVVVVACTNCVRSLDPALRRRFGKTIYVGLPDEAARYEILCKIFGGGAGKGSASIDHVSSTAVSPTAVSLSFDDASCLLPSLSFSCLPSDFLRLLSRVAKNTAGMSGSDLHALAREASARRMSDAVLRAVERGEVVDAAGLEVALGPVRWEHFRAAGIEGGGGDEEEERKEGGKEGRQGRKEEKKE